MALRLIEIVLAEQDCGKIDEILKSPPIVDKQIIKLPEEKALLLILLEAEQSESILDAIEKETEFEKNRLIVLPVQATLPRLPEKPPEEEPKAPERIDREELYETIKDASKCSKVYFLLMVLSAIVAIVGLYRNSTPIIIGAMVIAPLLGPNIGIAIGTTLGDLTLLRKALFAALAGIASVIVLTVCVGLILLHTLDFSEIGARIQLNYGDLAVALSAGCAGTLGFTTALPSALIGVMVAVSLLPPLVASGLLLGSGHFASAGTAFSLFLLNLICINIAAICTFLAQGIHPASWWEKDRAAKATRIALSLWISLLLLFGAVFWALKAFF